MQGLFRRSAAAPAAGFARRAHTNSRTGASAVAGPPKSLPASHTIKIAFTLPPDVTHGEIANVPGIDARGFAQRRSREDNH
jgi:hypothetical protein